MANSKATFIQIPQDVTNPIELRRFLDKLVEQVDILYGNRGSLTIDAGGVSSLIQANTDRLDILDPRVNNLVSEVSLIKDGEAAIIITADTTLTSSNRQVLVDASAANTTITLPPAADIFNSISNRSNMISISKIDTTNTQVIINPDGAELILGEPSISLVAEHEIINLITDGNNWYLGA